MTDTLREARGQERQMDNPFLRDGELTEIADALYTKVTPWQANHIEKLFTSHFYLVARVKELEAVLRKQAMHGLDELQQKILHEAETSADG